MHCSSLSLSLYLSLSLSVFRFTPFPLHHFLPYMQESFLLLYPTSIPYHYPPSPTYSLSPNVSPLRYYSGSWKSSHYYVLSPWFTHHRLAAPSGAPFSRNCREMAGQWCDEQEWRDEITNWPQRITSQSHRQTSPCTRYATGDIVWVCGDNVAEDTQHGYNVT